MKSSQMRQPRRHISPALGTAVAVWGGRGGHGPEQPHPRVPSPPPNCPISPHPHVPSVPMPPPTSTPQPSMSPTSPLIPMFPHNPLWTHCPPHTPHCPPHTPHCPPPPPAVTHQGSPLPLPPPLSSGGSWGRGGSLGGRGAGSCPPPPTCSRPPNFHSPPGSTKTASSPTAPCTRPERDRKASAVWGGDGGCHGGGGWGARTPPGCRMSLQPEDPLQNESPKCKETSKCGHPPPPTPRIWGAPKTWRPHPKMWGSHS